MAAALSLDARAFSSFGTLRQTGILGTTTFSDFTALRLDTTLSVLQPEAHGNLPAGRYHQRWPALDQAHPHWRRANAAQFRPAPRSGDHSAAAMSKERPPCLRRSMSTSAISRPTRRMSIRGPFKVDDIPVFTSNGTARVVLTDLTGRAVETETDFYHFAGSPEARSL